MHLAASVDDRELKNLAEKLDKILNGVTTQSLKLVQRSKATFLD
jgi:hypothetical protein